MAFFKFRFPGKSPVAAADSVPAASAESLEALRRRARHRLLGSVVLVFVAVVALPLFFDSQPRPVPVDTPIIIPERGTTLPLKSGAPVPENHAPAAPLLPGSAIASAPASQVPAHASLEPGKEEVLTPGMPPSTAAGPATTAEKSDVRSASQDGRGESVPKGEGRTAKETSRTDSEAQKAQALLEGRSTASDHARTVIQVGAFSDADKVREVRRKLEQAGIKTYIQSVEGKDGKRSTRVRVGPFDSRADADQVAARIRKLDLPASVITL